MVGTFLAILFVAAFVLALAPIKPLRNLGVVLLFLNLAFYIVVYLLHLTIA